jgi:hypothetical protein
METTELRSSISTGSNRNPGADKANVLQHYADKYTPPQAFKPVICA